MISEQVVTRGKFMYGSCQKEKKKEANLVNVSNLEYCTNLSYVQGNKIHNYSFQYIL